MHQGFIVNGKIYLLDKKYIFIFYFYIFQLHGELAIYLRLPVFQIYSIYIFIHLYIFTYSWSVIWNCMLKCTYVHYDSCSLIKSKNLSQNRNYLFIRCIDSDLYLIILPPILTIISLIISIALIILFTELVVKTTLLCISYYRDISWRTISVQFISLTVFGYDKICSFQNALSVRNIYKCFITFNKHWFLFTWFPLRTNPRHHECALFVFINF